VRESGPGAHSPVPQDRIPQPHPESGQERRPTIVDTGPESHAIAETLSRVRIPWRIDMTRISRLLARIGITAAAVTIPLVFGPLRQDPWDLVAQCESGGNWNTNTGNGYYGGLQFSPETWTSYGGGTYATTANRATRSQQIAIAEKVLRAQGWNAWPTCSKRVGVG
jgi:Transglycosylase-like domain